MIVLELVRVHCFMGWNGLFPGVLLYYTRRCDCRHILLAILGLFRLLHGRLALHGQCSSTRHSTSISLFTSLAGRVSPRSESVPSHVHVPSTLAPASVLTLSSIFRVLV